MKADSTKTYDITVTAMAEARGSMFNHRPEPP